MRLVLVAFALALGLGAATAAFAVGGPEIDVSKAPGAQDEATITIDPSNGRVLLAGSNSFKEGSMRVYTSGDGGATWTSSLLYPAPASYLTTCALDPGVAIDASGRQYFSFLRSTPCKTGHARLFVASRAWPHGGLGTAGARQSAQDIGFRRQARDRRRLFSSSPHRNRVYTAWSRISHNGVFSIVLSKSDDGGRTWSRIVKVNRTGDQETYASVAVARNGTVYVAWDDPTGYRLEIARSTDGGAHFEPERSVVPLAGVPIPSCGSGIPIPAMLRVCLHADPIVSVDNSRGPGAGRVYVSYTKTGIVGDYGVWVAAFDSRLRPLNGDGTAVAPAPPRTRPDQFWVPPPSIRRRERSGSASTTPQATRRARRRSTRAQSHATAARRGPGGSTPPRWPRTRRSLTPISASTATTKGSPSCMGSRTRSGRTRAT